MRLAASLIALGLLAGVATAEAEPRALSGPYRTLKGFCRGCKVVRSLRRLSGPYRAAKVIESMDPDNPQEDEFIAYLAIRVARGWYFRDLGRSGPSYPPHGEGTVWKWELADLEIRNVVAGGAAELVVSVWSSQGSEPRRRIVWVVGVGRSGVPHSEDLAPDQELPRDGLEVVFP